MLCRWLHLFLVLIVLAALFLFRWISRVIYWLVSLGGLLVLMDSFLSFVSDPIFFIIDLVEGFFRIF